MREKISQKSYQELEDSLHYLKLGELKAICKHFSLPIVGKKAEQIRRILTFLKSGEVILPPEIPDQSRKKKGEAYPLSPETKIVVGAYKSDKKTREFLKSLIGKHFHFTAYGQDWICERWFSANPPTYQEFANFWVEESKRRSARKATPKKEWAYLNFSQSLLEANPRLTRSEISQRWKEEQRRRVGRVFKILNIKNSV